MKSLQNIKTLLFAARISSEGIQREIDITDPNAHLSSQDFLWLHLCALHEDTREFLQDQNIMDDLVISAMLAEETRPRILIRDHGTLIIVRAVNLLEGCPPEDMISLRIWIEDKRIITTRMRDIKAIDDIKDFIKDNKGPRTSGEFLVMITDRVYCRMNPFIEDLEDRIGKIEENLARGEITVSDESAIVRLRTAIFTRYIVPQKIILETLIKNDFQWLTKDNKEHLVESLDKVTRYIETLADLRERFQIINDEINRIQDVKLNSTTYLFTVASTIFLPLSFLTGLLGVNVGGIPGVNNQMGFWFFSVACLLIVAAQVIIFKKKNWF